MTADRAGRRATAEELAILNHPDQRTSWAAIVAATLRVPDPDLPELVAQRLAAVAQQVPVLASRWCSGWWRPGQPPQPVIVDSEAVDDPVLLRRFDLECEPPVRVVIDRWGRQLSVAAHHAAFDGRGVLAVMAALLGAPLMPIDGVESDGPGARRPDLRGPLRRLLAPANRVAPSTPSPQREALAVRELDAGGLFTGRIAAACVEAVRAHNARRGFPGRRIGLSVARGGPTAIGNVASYRRLDLSVGDRVATAVHRALRDAEPPPEMVYHPRALRLLAPIAGRFSDSLLVSDLGRITLPGVDRVALFPTVHGRSAVAFGASEVADGCATLAIRARDLSSADAARLLDDAVRRLEHQKAPSHSARRASYDQIGV